MRIQASIPITKLRNEKGFIIGHSFLGDTVVSYTPSGFILTLPDSPSFVYRRLCVSVMKKILNTEIKEREKVRLRLSDARYLQIYLGKKWLTIANDYDREAWISRDGKSYRQFNKGDIITPVTLPTRISSRKGKKVKIGDWVVAKSKSSVDIFHKGTQEGLIEYCMDGEIFHYARVYYRQSSFINCNCKELVPDDVLVTAELIKNMEIK